MTNIKISLSRKSIDEAILKLKKYKNDVKLKSEQLIQRLVDSGVAIAQTKVLEMDINDTGNLLNSISGYYSPTLNAGFITVNCDYAVFVEFGTGIKGKNSPYPGTAMAEAGYQYMSGTTYITTKDGRVGWFYPADDGTWRFTEGLPSRPFMYETALELENQLNKIVREVFK